jgi:hypothetical protein
MPLGIDAWEWLFIAIMLAAFAGLISMFWTRFVDTAERE